MKTKLLALAILFCPICLMGEIIESATFAEVEKLVADKPTSTTLVLVDIDDTLIEADQQLGSVAWGRHVINELVSKGVPKDKAKEVETIFWEAIQTSIPTRLVDPHTPTVLSRLRDANFLVLGLTARAPNEIELTMEQLDAAGIDLNNRHPLTFRSTPNLAKPAAYAQGVLFSGHNKKSDVLLAFLDQNKICPELIIFVDDLPVNIQDVAQACQKRQIAYIGVRFSGADDSLRTFNPQIADIQWALFPTPISDAQAEKVLEVTNRVHAQSVSLNLSH